MRTILLVAVQVFIGLAVCQAQVDVSQVKSDLEAALKEFAGYRFGQPKHVLHDTRLAAFRGTEDERLRLKNEQLLLSFVQSGASLDARREACMWLSDLATEIGKPVLTLLAGQEDFADVAQIALDAIGSRKPGTPEAASALGNFKTGVAQSANPLGVLKKALLGTDEDQARLAFQLIEEGVETRAACAWLGQHIGELGEARQVIALNLVVQVNAAERATVVSRLSRDGKGSARLVAIRHSADVEALEQWLFGSDRELAGAAKEALIALPPSVVGATLVEWLAHAEASTQQAAIEIVSARPDSFATKPLLVIAGHEGHANRRAAIRALGKAGDVNEYPAVLEAFVASDGQAIQQDWQAALWEMSRRQPNYDQALEAIHQVASTAPEGAARYLEAMADKLAGMKSKAGLEHVRDPQKYPLRAKTAPAPAAKPPTGDILLPGSYQDITPKRFEVAAYLNCGPQNKTQDNGIAIECPKGMPWNSVPGTDPSLSVLFADAALDFNISGLNPGQDYVLGMTWWDSSFNGRRQSIHIHGREVLPDTRTIGYEEPNTGTKQHGFQGRPTPVRIQFALLPEHIQDGKCRVRIQRTGPVNAVTSELWVMQRSKPRAEKQVLLVSGQDYPGHRWRQTGPVVERLIAGDDRMEVTICETPYALGLQHLDVYDAVFVHFKNYREDLPSTRVMQENLTRYVVNGGGLCMSHFACGAFMEWPDFVKLSGRIWNGEGHDRRGPFTVKVVDQAHPVTRGLGASFDTDDELYFCLKGDPEIHLLCEAFSKSKKADHPQAFVLEPGKGRTFLCTLGHDVRAYEPQNVKQLYRQGTAWAAGLE